MDFELDETAAQRLAVGACHLEDNLRNGHVVYGKL